MARGYIQLKACREGAARAAEAASLTWRAATAAAAARVYGPACGLAVLAIEESVKARVYMAIGLHNLSRAPLGFTPALARRLLRKSHTACHALAALQALNNESRTRIAMGRRSQAPVPAVVQDDLGRENCLADAASTKQQGFYSRSDRVRLVNTSSLPGDGRREARRHVAPFLRETKRASGIRDQRSTGTERRTSRYLMLSLAPGVSAAREVSVALPHVAHLRRALLRGDHAELIL